MQTKPLADALGPIQNEIPELIKLIKAEKKPGHFFVPTVFLAIECYLFARIRGIVIDGIKATYSGSELPEYAAYSEEVKLTNELFEDLQGAFRGVQGDNLGKFSEHYATALERFANAATAKLPEHGVRLPRAA